MRPLDAGPATRLGQSLFCLGESLESQDVNFIAIVEEREDVEADVLRRIGDHTRDRPDSAFPAEIHHPLQFRNAEGVHRVQATEVRQNFEAFGQVRQLDHDLIDARSYAGQVDVATKVDTQLILGHVGRNRVSVVALHSGIVKVECNYWRTCEEPGSLGHTDAALANVGLTPGRRNQTTYPGKILA